jgi:transglutaminase-like putative cysteine protease
MKTLSLLAMSILIAASAARAAEPTDPQVRFGRYHVAYAVNANGTATETHEWTRTVLKEPALEKSKTATIGHSTSAQKAEVLAAYTLKADGRRIEVPKDNYQLEVNSGKGKDSPMYSDWTTLTVVFPDLAVGDTVGLSYRLTDTEAMFPGHFSAGQLFYRNTAYDDIRVRIDYPASMWVQFEGRGMKESLDTTQNERRIVEWTWTNPKPVKSTRRDWSVFDPEKEVGYAFSTFRNYAEIAAAYGARANPKAAVTERIAKLAGEIAKGKAGKKEQARALYEWVATHITYGGNCIGVGAVVPRDIDLVLDNKMGDCKDHATLLQALLTATGIKSTQALVNAGSTYRLQRIPMVFGVNHVITYLPEFDLFVDSTSDSTPFGMLPFNAQDKPVLLVDGHRDGFRTPAAPAAQSRQTVHSLMKVAADGSVSGSVEVTQAGRDAVAARAWARNMTREVEQDLVKNAFRRMGIIGSGTLEKDDPNALIDSYRYKASFRAEKFMKTSGAGAFYIFPPLNIAQPIISAAQSVMEPEKDADVACMGGTMTEEYVIELPKGVKVLSVPGNLKVGNELASYQASYKLKGATLTVKRVLEDRTKGNVCAPALIAKYRPLAEKIIDNLKEQVLYK